MDEEIIRLTAEPADAGERLDRLLARHISDVSRSTIQKWIADGRVSVDGKPARASHKTAAGQVIEIRVPPPQRFELRPEAIPLEIIYEDDDLAVVNKPAGMVVHPAAGHWSGTLVNALMARFPELSEREEEQPDEPAPRPGIVHRLDKDTSGLMIIAKTARVAEKLQAQFQEHRVHKTYLALVEGVPRAGAGLIDAPIGRDPRQRKRMAVVREGRPAQTSYRVARQFAAHALLEVEPLTGRTHQIRVHLAYIGHPVVGDPVYGRRRASLACPRQFLHATRLTFTHPTTGAPMSFEVPLPADLQRVLATL